MGLLRKKQHKAQPGRRTSQSGEGGGADQRVTYRRNRTLTGSLASDVVSVGETRAELQSSRVKGHHLRRHRRRLSTYFMVSIVAAIALGYLFFQVISHPTVTTTADRAVDGARFTAAIQQYLAEHPLQRFRFSVDTDELARYLQTHGEPEVAHVSAGVDSDGIGGAIFHVIMRHPVVVWDTGSSKLYVDNEGNAFGRSYFSDPGVAVVDETGIQAQDNQVLASNRFLGFIGKAIGDMKSYGYKVTKVVLPQNTTRQIELSLEGVSYPVRFTIDRPSGEQAEDAMRAIRYLTSKDITARYLDVRVSGRAYYR